METGRNKLSCLFSRARELSAHSTRVYDTRRGGSRSASTDSAFPVGGMCPVRGTGGEFRWGRRTSSRTESLKGEVSSSPSL